MSSSSPAISRQKFPILFIGFMIALMGAYYSLPSTLIESVIVRFFAVVPGSMILNSLTPGLDVSSEGTRIVSTLARLNVLKGCEGTEVLLMLYSAILASLRPVKFTLVGLVAGTLLVFILNQLRIISLFFIVAYQRDWFELVHGFLAPVIIVALTGLLFLVWMIWAQQPRASQTP